MSWRFTTDDPKLCAPSTSVGIPRCRAAAHRSRTGNATPEVLEMWVIDKILVFGVSAARNGAARSAGLAGVAGVFTLTTVNPKRSARTSQETLLVGWF